MNEIQDAGPANDPDHEERELGLVVQHLATQNMHLTWQLHDFQRKIRELESMLQNAKQESYLEKQNSEHLLEKLQVLEAEKDIKNLNTMEQVIPMTSEVSTQIEIPTQTDECMKEPLDDHFAKNRMEIEKFKEEMNKRREVRHQALGAVSSELERLRGELAAEKLARQEAEKQLQVAADTERQDQDIRSNTDLLQNLESLKTELEQENKRIQDMEMENQHLQTKNEQLTNRFKEESLKYEAKEKYSKRCIGALKEVATLSKQMLSIRESQVSNLKSKLEYLQESMAGNKGIVEIKAELESHIQKLNQLQVTYEERIAELTLENNELKQDKKDKSQELEVLINKCSDLEARLAEMATIDSERNEINRSLQTQLQLSCDERNSLANERELINSIFSQMIAANSSTDIDLDKLVKMLKENHDLITEMTAKDDGNNTVAGLPKLVIDLINQIDNEERNLSPTSVMPESNSIDQEKDSSSEELVHINGECSSTSNDEEIASNFPKVCRLLTELLSHHKVPSPAEEFKPSCYKSVETPSGPRLVPSVSNTYIRLKDLILEKKSLVRDLDKLKQLNIHLESKLQEQEQRLSFVTDELKKTWGVVGKLRSQYKQLRTHEQILRYELQQKRHLLTELKTELEYCRDKWEQAREMNSKTEIEWKQLRQEFADRKKQDRNHSGESGFSEDREVESGEEEEKPCLRPHNTSINIHIEGQPYSSWMQHTIPLHFITNLKQQLDIFSRDIDSLVITETQRYSEKQLIDSIFSLPPIQIPDPVLTKCKKDSISDLRLKKEETEITKDKIVSSQTSQSTERNLMSTVNGEKSVDKLVGQPELRTDHKSAEEKPSTSGENVVRDALGRTPEEVLAARAARLKRLEEQTQLLFNKVTRTTNLSNALNNRLEELHEQYGVPNPPPLPQTLPAIRIPLESASQAAETTQTEPGSSKDNVPEETHQP